MVNKVVLVGRIGRAPVPSGGPVASFSVATSETWKDKSGTEQEKTEWHNVIAWNKLAEI
jgi:single-strand DNA-binding protein